MKNLLSLSILTWILINGLVNNIGASQKQSPCQKGSDYLPDQVVVKFQPAVGDVESSSLFSSIYQKYQVKRAERLFPNVKYQPTPKRKIVDLSRIYLLQVPEDSDIEIICKELGGMPGVAYAEPYYIFYVDEIPNDPRYMYQHHLPQIKAPEAWDMAKGDSTVVIAMVDNGTDWKHPDLLDNIYTNEAEAKGLPGVDDDKNGKVDDIHGWDLAEDDNDPTNTPKDAEGYWIHGTHTAGLASAVTNNGVGVAGVSWNCEILPVKCSRDNSPKSVVAGYQGIQYAADMGADVINCSWGGFGSFSQALQDVIDYAHALGSLIVASAGNDPTDAPHYPSAYWNVLSVTWVGRNDVKSSDAPWGPTVDVAAPGELLHSTIPVAGGSYGTMSGSSAAAPLVSGLCGLVKAAHKDWSNADMAFQVVETADNIDEKNPDYIGQLGSGRINAYRALTETVSPKPKIFLLSYTIDDTQGGNGNGAIEAGEQVRLMVKLKNEWGDATNVIAHLRINDWAVTVTKSTSSWGIIKGLRNITANVVDNSTDPFIIAIDSLALPHRIPVKVELTADNGYAQSYHFALAITPSILLVDDDEIDVEKYYIAILDSLHYSFEYWEHEQKGTPGDLSAFSTVIWSCEWTFPSLDAEDRKVITNYLDEGGNLFLTGQDIGWDLCDPATIQDPSLPDNQFELSNGVSKTFYETYLHARYLLDDSQYSNLTGVAGDPIGDGLSFSVYQPGREADNQYPSEVDTINGGISIFNYPNGSSGAVRYAADYRVVYFAFGGWEAIVEPEVRAEVMARVLDWLNGLKVEHTPVKDTEDTAHDYKVTVKVTSSVQPVGRVELYWDTDGALPFKKIPMTDLGDGQYQAFIPAQPLGTEIQYLIFVQTTTGYYSPYTIYSFHVGADTTPPVFVSINKAPNTLDKKGPYPFSATIEDNQGVDTSSVYVHFKLADGKQDSLKMSPGTRPNLFEALIPGGVSYGDTIAYYLSAQDIASVPNRALSQTYRFVVGYEDFESGLGFWEVVGEGWGLDASARYSGDYSVNESPGGNYPPNTNTALTMKSGLDLSSTSYAALFFWTRYLLQYNKAFGYVEVSVDSGKTWKQLGDPIARLQSQWVQKGLSLQDYVGHTDVRLRFRLVSDATALPNFDGWFLDDILVRENIPTAVPLASASEALPETFDLSQNYPNPFSAAGIKSETRISYQLPRASQVSLKIYNTLGQLIKTLVDQKKEAGFHTTFWDGRDEQGRMVASGIYFYQLKAKDFIQTRKMLWLR